MAAMDFSSEGLKHVASSRRRDQRSSPAGRWPVWKSLLLLAGASLALWAAIGGGLYLLS